MTTEHDAKCEHDPRYSRSECMCGYQVSWCAKCNVSLCRCDASQEESEIALLRAQVKAAHDLLDEWERKHTHLGIERSHHGPSSHAWRVIFPATSPDRSQP